MPDTTALDREASTPGPRSVTLTRTPGRRLGPLRVDLRNAGIVTIAGDLPDRFTTVNPRRYRTLIATGIVTIAAPSMREPTVSVIIPAHNPPATFANLVAGLKQRRWVSEVIVVDDASKEPVNLDGITVIRNATPLGPGASRNLGADASQGELLLFVDADILTVDPDVGDALKLLLHPDIGALAPRIVEARHGSPLDLGPHPTLVDHRHLNHLPAAVLAVARRSFLTAGGFSEELRLGEDVALVARIVAHDEMALYLPSITATHAPQSRLTRRAKSVKYGYSIGALRKATDLALMPTITNAPFIGITLAAPLAWAITTTLTHLAKIQQPLTFAERIKLATVVLDTQLDNNAELIVRQLGLPIGIGALGSKRLRRALILAIAIRAAHQGLAQTLDDLAYSAGMWLSLVLEA